MLEGAVLPRGVVEMIGDIAGAFFKVVFELIGLSKERWLAFLRVIIQPVLVIVLASILGFAYVAYREEGVQAGWKLLFPDTKLEAYIKEAQLKAIILQDEIRQVARSDAKIKEYLDMLLNEAPGVARLRLGVIHNGVVNGSGAGMLKFDITHAVAVPGRVAGDLIQNQPMNGWTRSLPELLAGRCSYYPVNTMDYAAGRDRLMRMGTVAVLTCPITNSRGQLLGALFLQFDDINQVPKNEAMDKLQLQAKDSGRVIATALDLR